MVMSAVSDGPRLRGLSQGVTVKRKVEREKPGKPLVASFSWAQEEEQLAKRPLPKQTLSHESPSVILTVNLMFGKYYSVNILLLRKSEELLQLRTVTSPASLPPVPLLL